VVRAAARFPHHLGCIQLAKEGFDLTMREVAPEYRAFSVLDAVAREHGLGRVDRDALIPAGLTVDVLAVPYRHGGLGPPSAVLRYISKIWMAEPRPAMTVSSPCSWVNDWGAWY
jgi:hypothetical protein